MEKIAVETEIWPADVKYAEEITEASLAKLGEKFMQRMWELPRGKKVCVSCMEQRETPPSGMPMVIRILLYVQEVQEVQEKNIPAGAGNFLAACGPLGGLYTVLSFPPFSIIDKIQTREPDAGRM